MAESRLKGWLDWAHHLYWISEGLVSLGAGKAVTQLAGSVLHIDSAWQFPIWLVLSGILLFCFAMLTSRRRASKSETPQPKPETNEDMTLLSPLQIEALKFRKQLLDFLAEYGPRSAIKVEDYPDTPEGILQFNRDKDKTERPGGFAFYGQFASRFKDDAEKLYYKFLAAGVTNTHFGSLAAAVNTRSNVEELIRMLWEMAGAADK